MSSYETKLIDLTETHAEVIAADWYRNVCKNSKTRSYQGIPEEDAIRQAITFYRDMRSLFFTDNIFESSKKIFTKYADQCFADLIPLQEAIYALILMRRQLWLFAEFQAIFITPLEQHQAIECLNRTILVFDYAMYVITQRYQELFLRDPYLRECYKKVVNKPD